MEKLKNIFFNRVEPFSTTSLNPRRDGSVIEFREFFKFEKFFIYVGYPYLGCDEVRGSKFRKNLFIAVKLFQFVMIMLSAYTCMIFIRENNFLALVESATYPQAHVNVLIRFFYFFILKREDIKKIVEKLDKIFPHHGLDQHFYGVRKYLKELNLLTGIVIFWFHAMSFQFLFCTFEVAIYGWWTSQEVGWVPIYLIKFPFDTSSPFLKWSIYVIEFIMESTVMLTFLLTEQVYAGLMTLTAMEFDILARKISEAESDEELKNLIHIHQQLIEVTEKLKEIFSPLVMANILLTILVNCVGAFLTAVQDVATKIFVLKFGFAFALTFSIGFTQCRFAQKLIDSSESVALAAYNTPWFEKDLKFRKLVLIIMIKAQKPQQMTAWRFFGVSMETYYWILQTSHSYFSFLMGTQEA